MPDRSKDRRRALDLLFEADQRRRAGDGVAMIDLLAQRMADPSGLKPMRTYAAEIVEGVAEHLARIDELLESYSHSWTLERMPAVDLALLRIGAWELLYNDDVPDAVAVEQAVDLAAELSTDESPAFVNGLLGQLQRHAPALRDATAAPEVPQ
ncbi:transcription antitermination factor NusB [Litorihabitans aurantiacus]|uniref:Transcription antitermination protein NusB n=1 Tax=Litorihabitans aurantiacus TaxID=1930061 RepID=A0AA37UMM3_9MICO|nr:transcription antitermination factor NusB [Litorihabitans aurantiacus]GMA31315.1 N utilization substance protein B [Litorihabitans aurantiacus]